MLVNVVLKDWPRWAALTKAQQRYVYAECIHSFLMYWPIKLVKRLLMPGLGVALFIWSGAMANLWMSFLALFVLVFVIDELVDWFFIVRNKDRIDLFIQTHAEEIAIK